MTSTTPNTLTRARDLQQEQEGECCVNAVYKGTEPAPELVRAGPTESYHTSLSLYNKEVIVA